MYGVGAGNFGVGKFYGGGYRYGNDWYVVDEGVEVFGTGYLGISVVNHFVEEFVDEDEVRVFRSSL